MGGESVALIKWSERKFSWSRFLYSRTRIPAGSSRLRRKLLSKRIPPITYRLRSPAAMVRIANRPRAGPAGVSSSFRNGLAGRGAVDRSFFLSYIGRARGGGKEGLPALS